MTIQEAADYLYKYRHSYFWRDRDPELMAQAIEILRLAPCVMVRDGMEILCTLTTTRRLAYREIGSDHSGWGSASMPWDIGGFHSPMQTIKLKPGEPSTYIRHRDGESGAFALTRDDAITLGLGWAIEREDDPAEVRELFGVSSV